MYQQSPQFANALDELLSCISKADDNFKIQTIPPKVLLLMGDSKAGKTTLLYYLLGKPLQLKINELGVQVLEPQTIYNHASVGNGFDSETVYPNIPPDSGLQQIMIIDMPGFNDTRPLIKLLNLYILIQTINLIEEVHVCQVIPQMFIQSTNLLEELQKICSFLNQNVILTEKTISFVITKVQDEHTVQNFNSYISNMLQEGECAQLSEKLMLLLKCNKYEFKNEKPEEQIGVKLKHKIVQQNNFMPIHKKYQKFLSPKFCRSMIGQDKITDFQICLKDVINLATQTYLNVVKLASAVISYEYSQVLSFLLEVDSKEYQQSLITVISQSKSNLKLTSINNTNFTPSNTKCMNISKYINIFSIFSQKGQQNSHDFLYNWLNNAVNIFEFKEHSWTAFSADCIKILQSTIKQVASLMLIIRLIDLPQLQQTFESLKNNQKIRSAIEQFYIPWEKNIQKIIKYEGFKTALSDKDVRQAYSAKFGNITYRQIIKITRVYRNVKKKQLRGKVQEIIKTTKQDKLPLANTSSINITSQNIQQQLRKIPLNSASLKSLFQLLSIKQPESNKRIDTIIINKVSAIFKRFSMFQEAIMFKMCISDIKSILQLMEIATVYHLVSPQFVKNIVLPYYDLSPPSAIQSKDIQTCYNYLLYFSKKQQEFVELQQYFLRKVKILKKNIETSQTHEKYPYDDFYIKPIQQNFSFYFQHLKHKQSQFQHSNIKNILITTDVANISK